MGGAAPTPAKGGKRTMDAAVNLVPYIDLLMTIMTFLVMTAVWTQIAALEVQNQSGGPPEQEQEKDPDAPKPILVSIMEEKIQVQEEGADALDFPKGQEDYNFEGIFEELKRLKDARPERVEVKIKAEDKVGYEAIVKVIDSSTGLGLTGLTLQPASQ